MLKKYIGIDIGGTTIKFALIDEEGTILNRWNIVTDVSESGENIIPDIIKSVQKRNEAHVFGIGVGVPGPVVNGFVKQAVNLGWKDVSLKADLENALNVPVVTVNDANAAALGELWQSALKGVRNLVFITIGTGVGGGVVFDNKIVSGANASGGEIGHIPIHSDESRICGCGNVNCLECYASASGMVKTMNKLLDEANVPERVKGTKEIFERMDKGDLLAQETFAQTINYLGQTIAGIVNTFDPQEIVIGGGVSDAGDALLIPLREEIKKYCFPQIRNNLNLRKAVLGNEAGVIGAIYQLIN